MGSPPPMRGKDKNDDFGVQQIGITPAYAGKSIVERRCKSQWRDHPRLCGEKVSAVGVFSPFNGSPPPMRGKGGVKVLSATERRITPAYAGKSQQFPDRFRFLVDHPRLCGEKLPRIAAGKATPGSPPPMRGKGIGRVLGTADVRITPAYAGKRKDIIKSNALNRDHPRLCGEKMETGILDGQMMGSPPPMRGKDIYASDVVQQAGITPAYAGKSAPDTQWTHHIQDHPRLCGEKSRSPLWLATKIGSPPPMRGKVRKLPP